MRRARQGNDGTAKMGIKNQGKTQFKNFVANFTAMEIGFKSK